MKKVFIKENALAAKIAARILKTDRVAIVFSKTIYLHNVSAKNFLRNTKWVLHELKHIQQYETAGTIPFILRYSLLSLKYGYNNNPYELAACAAEQEDTLFNNYTLVY
ncbi:MAG: DUF4157 domain-containing protein [Bacteroidetes bacterium]|nr:DUF4157 domain-containing protein [Bacteroidota bacterium]